MELSQSICDYGAWTPFNTMNHNMKLTLITALLLASSIFAAEPAKAPKSLNGSWKPIKGELAGKPMKLETLNAITLTISNSMYHVVVEPEGHDMGTTKIDPSVTPKAIDVTGTNGPNAGKTFPSIYEFDGDKLRICYDLSGKKRPTEFKSVTNSMLFLVAYERKKP